jgi:hypothetical protein
MRFLIAESGRGIFRKVACHAFPQKNQKNRALAKNLPKLPPPDLIN